MIHRLNRLNQMELPICLFFNRISHQRFANRFFAVVSRLGDGVFWYTLMATLPFLYGIGAMPVVVHMTVTAIVILLVYKLLKSNTYRIRPYRYSDSIFQNVAALDQFSFPSGHTMHAVSFSMIVQHYYPVFYWLVTPFTVLVAMSRLVLGLHYPSDVLAGFLIAASISGASLFVSNTLF